LDKYNALDSELLQASNELQHAQTASREVFALEAQARKNEKELADLRKELEKKTQDIERRAKEAADADAKNPRQAMETAMQQAVRQSAVVHVPFTTGNHGGTGTTPKTIVEALSAVPESLPEIYEDNIVSTQKGMRRIRLGHSDSQVDNTYVVCQTIVERISHALVTVLFTDEVPTAVPSASQLQSIAVQHTIMICEDAKRPHTPKVGGCGYDAAQDIGESWQAVYATCAIAHAIGLRMTMWRAAPVLECTERRSHWLAVCALALLGLGMFTKNTVASLLGLSVGVLTANANVKDLSNAVHNSLFPTKTFSQTEEPAHIINNYDMIRSGEAAGTLFAELPIPFQLRPSTRGDGERHKCTFSQRVSDLSPGQTAVVLGQPLLAMLGPTGPACPKLPERAYSSSGPSLSAPTSTPPLATAIHSSVQSSAGSSFLIVNPTHPNQTLSSTLGSFWKSFKTSVVATSSRLGASITGLADSVHPKEVISSMSKTALATVDHVLETSVQYLQKVKRNQSVANSTIQAGAQDPEFALPNMSMTEISPPALTKTKSGSGRGVVPSPSESPVYGASRTGSFSTSTQQMIRLENGTQANIVSMVNSGPSNSIAPESMPVTESKLSPWPSGSFDDLACPSLSSTDSTTSSTTFVPLAEGCCLHSPTVSPVGGAQYHHHKYRCRCRRFHSRAH